MRRLVLAAVPLVLVAAFVLWGSGPERFGVRPELLRIDGDRFADPAAALGPDAHLLPDPRSAALYGVQAAAHGFWNDGTSVLLLGGGPRPGADILDQVEDRLKPFSRWQAQPAPVQTRGFDQGDGVEAREFAAGSVAALIMGPGASTVAGHARALPAFPAEPANIAQQLLDDHQIATIAVLAAFVLLWEAALLRIR